jgi:hypothetical protein
VNKISAEECCLLEYHEVVWPYGVIISQKTAFFIVTTMKTSKLTKYLLLLTVEFRKCGELGDTLMSVHSRQM